ncbi:MAG TPA: hypothetical protein VGN57_19495 [Pirellulaceae bacterium]|jgi:hypothetical protein|nr:hypothetical protein [Pirellulaceae bacterium]
MYVVTRSDSCAAERDYRQTFSVNVPRELMGLFQADPVPELIVRQPLRWIGAYPAAV